MRKYLLLAGISCILASCTLQNKVSKATPLFNGKDLNDWTIKIKDHPINENYGNTFSVADGAMKVSYDKYDDFKEQYGHIFYKKKFSAYLLVVEYRFTGEQVKNGPGWAIRNSGAMLHCQPPETMDLHQDFPISLEEQYLGGNGKDERSTANLCTPGTNVVLDKQLYTQHCVNSRSTTYPGDQWVHIEALVLGDSIIKHIAGADTVLVYEKPQYDGKDKWVKQMGYKDGALIKDGYISLQSESHPVEFRKVAIYNLERYMYNPAKLKQVIALLQNRKNK
ncbi:MAG: DUF1080 domain-containing protein [Chitinophagaceae bacterium]